MYLPVTTFLFRDTRLIDFRHFTFAGLLDKGNIALCAQLLECLLVMNLLFLDCYFLFKHITLFLTDPERLFIGDGLVLISPCKRFLAFNFE